MEKHYLNGVVLFVVLTVHKGSFTQKPDFALRVQFH
jgi:hypothetical protein